jgi:hypothetical protein
MDGVVDTAAVEVVFKSQLTIRPHLQQRQMTLVHDGMVLPHPQNTVIRTAHVRPEKFVV